MRRVPAVVTLALVCAAGAGCSAGTSEGVSGHVGTYAATGEGGDGALLEGTVRLEDGCLFVEVSTGERFLAYFPDDEVEWSEEGLRYGGSTYGSGDSIALGGGTSSATRPVPSDCREGFEDLTQWTVAQSGYPSGGSADTGSTGPAPGLLSPRDGRHDHSDGLGPE